MNTIRKKIVIVIAWALVVPALIFPQVSFWKTPVAFVYAADSISDLQDEASDIQKDIDKANAEKAKLEKNLGQIQNAVSSTQAVINKTQAAIAEAEQTISRKEGEIKNMNGQIELKKEMLRGFIQQFYYIKNQPILNVVLAEKDFSDVFSSADNLLTLGDKIVAISQDIAENKNQVEQDKIQLVDVKQQHEAIFDQKVDQKQELLADKAEVAADVAEKEATISELQAKLAELQGDLNKLTGKSYSAKNIQDAVEFASGKTGVPKGVLYGFLKMETNLGANTGQCTYEQVVSVSLPRYKKLLKTNKKWQASIDLLNKRQTIFYDIVKSLGYNKSKKVSCSPSGYIGQGGAMGVSQFMSDTWKGYSARITAKTGNSKPDPWGLTDGVMAMAIKLSQAGATSDSASAIKKASINYLGTFYANYYNGIVYWSKNYKRLFN